MEKKKGEVALSSLRLVLSVIAEYKYSERGGEKDSDDDKSRPHPTCIV